MKRNEFQNTLIWVHFLLLIQCYDIWNFQLPLTEGFQLGIYTYCLISLAYCLNALFFVYQTKYTFGFNILQLFDNPTTKKADCTQFVQRNFAKNFANSREFAHFQFFLNPHLGFENLENFENMFVCTNKNLFLMNFAR